MNFSINGCGAMFGFFNTNLRQILGLDVKGKIIQFQDEHQGECFHDHGVLKMSYIGSKYLKPLNKRLIKC